MNSIPEVAFRNGFHQKVHDDMARECKAMLDARPTCEFEELEEGKTYLFKPSYGTAWVLIVVTQTTPKRRQALASINHRDPTRIYKGNYYGKFIELDTDLITLVGITHSMIVTAAVAAGLQIPPEVRRQYPALFIEIPERFANGRYSAVERVTHSLTPPPFARGPVTPASIDAWIAEAHESIASLRCERTRRVALNPATAPDYDQYLIDYRNDIDFYRWLRNLVDTGGVFYIPAED